MNVADLTLAFQVAGTGLLEDILGGVTLDLAVVVLDVKVVAVGAYGTQHTLAAVRFDVQDITVDASVA